MRLTSIDINTLFEAGDRNLFKNLFNYKYNLLLEVNY
jgi:hypothetical protein